MKAAVLYYSHKGKTAGYAREIAMYLWSKGLNVSLWMVCGWTAPPQALEGFQPANSWTCKSRTYAFLYHL